jgi:hypothetical protein
VQIDTRQRFDRHGFGLRIKRLRQQGLIVPFGLIDDLGVDGHVQGGFAISLQPIDGLHDRVLSQKTSLPSIPSRPDTKVMNTNKTIENLLTPLPSTPNGWREH